MNNFFSNSFNKEHDHKHSHHEYSHQQSFSPSFYPEEMILNVETMTFSKAKTCEHSHFSDNGFGQSDSKEQPGHSATDENYNHQQNQNLFGQFSNIGNLLTNLKNNPLAGLLAGNDALSGMLKNGLSGQNSLNLQTLAQLFSNNKSSKKRQEEKKVVIDIDSSYEEI